MKRKYNHRASKEFLGKNHEKGGDHRHRLITGGKGKSVQKKRKVGPKQARGRIQGFRLKIVGLIDRDKS